MNALGRIITILLAIILILFLPLQYIAQSQVETMDHIVEAHTHKFTDSVRQKGSISIEDYEEYLNKIDQTKELYNIEIEHATPKTLSDLTYIQEDTRLVSNGLTIVPDSSKKSSIDEEIKSFATHTHTEACYNGKFHVCNGRDCEYDNSNTEIMLNTVTRERSGNEYRYTRWLVHSNDGGQTWGNRVELEARYGSNPVNATQQITYGSDGGYYYLQGDVGASVYKYDPVTNSKSNRYKFSSSYKQKDIMYRNNMFFVTEDIPVSHSATRIWSSPNGTGFTAESQLGSQVDINSIVYKNGIYVAAGHKFEPSSGVYNKGIVYSSTDGINWTNRLTINTSSGSNNSASVILAGDRFICGTSSSYQDYYSYDGINWSSIQKPSMFNSTNHVYGNNTLVVYDSSNRRIYTSTDFWKTYSYTSTSSASKLLGYHNGYFYMIDSSIVNNNGIANENGFMKSVNGVTWMKTPYPDHTASRSETVYDIIFNSVGDMGHSGPCLKEGKYYDNNGYEVQPICNQVVTSIRAKYPTQTVDKGKAINTTAIATYLDGHEGEVVCSSNYISNKGGLQTVTLTYSGKVDNAKTNGTKTATINVTVIDKKVSSIVVTPSTQIIERYQDPSFIVRAQYEDGSSNIIDNYTMSGFNNKNIGKQVVTFLYTENSVTVTSSVEVTVTNLTKVCTECGSSYELDSNDIDNGCPNCASIIIKIEAVPDFVTVNQGSALPITVYAIYRNAGKAIINNWTSNYEPLRLGYQQVTISYNEFKDYITVEVKATKKSCAICGNDYHLNEDGSDPGCPTCRITVISIKAEPNPIIIEMHQPLNLIVTATFKDGHTELVNGWSTDMIPNIPGTFNITLFYKSVTDQIVVTILDYDLTECPYCGISFSKSKHPNGCPDCSVTLIGIEASLRNGGTTVIKGSKLDLEISLIYKDTHREATYNGYTISNYQADLIGEQTIIVKYKDFRYNLVIEVVNTFGKITCPNGHVYHLNEDGSDPGCPYCIDDGEREKTVVYYDITYTTEIIEALYNHNIYKMKTGDYITIVVTKKNKSLRSQIIKIFNFSKEMNNTISYGGEVIG